MQCPKTYVRVVCCMISEISEGLCRAVVEVGLCSPGRATLLRRVVRENGKGNKFPQLTEPVSVKLGYQLNCSRTNVDSSLKDGSL